MLKLPDNATIDSLKLRIPDSEVEIISDTLKGSWIYTNDETGEIDDVRKKQFEVFDRNGINVRCIRQHQQTGMQIPVFFLVIQVSSKVLENSYFEGIHRGNLKVVYDFLQAMNIASFSFESFLQADCVDVDYKRDYFYKGDFIEPLRMLYGKVKPTKIANAELFSRKTNIGLSLSDRKSTKIATNPFLKFYHKGKELQNKSIKFYTTYLSKCKVEDIVRMETTVKNKKHFRIFDIEDTTLENISSLTHEQTSKFFDKAMNAHFQNRQLTIKKVEGLTPTDQVYLNTLYTLMSEARLTFGQSLMAMINGLDKVPKSRTKKKIESIYFEHIKGEKVDIENEKISQFFSQIGFV